MERLGTSETIYNAQLWMKSMDLHGFPIPYGRSLHPPNEAENANPPDFGMRQGPPEISTTMTGTLPCRKFLLKGLTPHSAPTFALQAFHLNEFEVSSF